MRFVEISDTNELKTIGNVAGSSRQSEFEINYVDFDVMMFFGGAEVNKVNMVTFLL